MASALAIIDTDRQLLATEAGLFLRQRASGELMLDKPIEADNPATRSNDARVHPCGAFWVGTMGKKEERAAGAIYWFMEGRAQDAVHRRHHPQRDLLLARRNHGLSHRAGEQRPASRRLRPGKRHADRKAAIFRDHRGETGSLDGAVVDAEGVIWNALWGAGRVDAYSAAGGLLESVPVPARKASCPAFIGANADRLAVTCAWAGMNEEERAADPHAGKTFLLDIPVQGRLEPKVLL